MDFLHELQGALDPAYVIERELGGGGMARVFLAEERRPRRKVVVKVLPPDLAAEINITRFEREIEFAAQLQHPQIVPVFAAGEVNGAPFYTMPFIDGESLGARLARGPLSCLEAIDVLRDVAKALAFAHGRGVVHRDIKPNNILLTSGSAVVTDFGIAKALAKSQRGDHAAVTNELSARATITQLGMTIGTPAYMAPEQVAGDESIDHRADLYAFGCVAFEMLAGSPPFTAKSLPALLAAHLTQKPVAVRERRPDVPPGLAGLIARCLEKDPEARPPNATALLASLERASMELSGPRAAAPAAAPGATPRRVSIAVLPFKDLAADPANEHLGIGLADATITDLASVKALIVRPTSAILSYRNRTTDALQAARDLAVDAVVDGNFQRAGNRLRITVQLIAAKDGGPLWATKLTTSLDDVFQMQDEVAHSIVEALQLELTRSEADSLARATPVQGDAYEAYFRGRLLLGDTIEEINTAIEWFKKALEIDPSFARAYAGLADAYSRIAFAWLPDAEWYARAEEMCNRALSLDPQLAEGRYLRGRLLWTPQTGFDHVGAMREFTAAIAAQPSLIEAHRALGILLFHLSMIEESAECFERALAIDPHDRIAYMHLGYCAYLDCRFEDAFTIIEQSGREISSSWNLYSAALVQIQLGRLDASEQTAEIASRRFPGNVLFYPVRALIAAIRGDRERAMEQIDGTIRNQKAFGHYHHAQYDVACAFAQLGDIDLAMQWLVDCASNGFPCGRFFARDPLLLPVHSDARFGKLLASVDDECDRYAAVYAELRKQMA